MPDILLATLNARYAHSSFGLRYLMANLGELEQSTVLLEFDISQRSVDILESILLHSPRIVGLGVYIWNVDQTTRLVSELKRVAPRTIVVLGGPEVSYECRDLELTEQADFIIAGEADLTFPEVCRDLLAGRRPLTKIIPARLPQFPELHLPYRLYSDRDLQQRVVYVEASRGCPFTCEFCLSALDIPVRQANLEPFLAEMDTLFRRGLRQFKFVDRTFNLNLQVSRAILQFFLDRYEPGLFLHFEMIPDRLPESLRDLIRQFPGGALQFEVGIQTFNDEVCELISRRQNVPKLEENLRFLRNETGVHVHADLIVGLPGEDIDSFGAGFDRLVELQPQEIQVGILKRLRGTPIVRHDAEWEMVFSPSAPYEILRTRLIDFETMQRLRRFARYWDLVANSGNFLDSTPLIWKDASPFQSFLRFSDWLFAQTRATNGIALAHLAEHLFRFLTEVRRSNELVVANAIWTDYSRAGRSDKPAFLRPYSLSSPVPLRNGPPLAPTRQTRHLG